MTTVATVRLAAQVLAEEAGADAAVERVEVAQSGTGLVVRVHTTEPGRFIGRRGATADAINRRLAEVLGTADVRFVLTQARPAGPPVDPPSGVREPRRPGPGAPGPGIGLDEPIRRPA